MLLMLMPINKNKNETNKRYTQGCYSVYKVFDINQFFLRKMEKYDVCLSWTKRYGNYKNCQF